MNITARIGAKLCQYDLGVLFIPKCLIISAPCIEVPLIEPNKLNYLYDKVNQVQRYDRNDRIELKCISPGDVGIRNKNLKWQRYGRNKTLPSKSSDENKPLIAGGRAYHTHDVETLIIDKADKSDEGVYSCIRFVERNCEKSSHRISNITLVFAGEFLSSTILHNLYNNASG